MRLSNDHSLRSLASVIVLAMVALLLPLSGYAFAATLPTMEVDPEVSDWNQRETVTLSATLTSAAPKNMRIHWENENGVNDPDSSTSRTNPDRNCLINQGTNTCSITYTATRTGNDQWRAWVDQDFAVNANVALTTDDSDQTEGRDEAATPGSQPQNTNPAGDTCQTSLTAEPDCTDVVLVRIGALEGAPDVQTLDAGATARLTARMFAPVQQSDGINIDFENENGSNDPDASTSRQTPDLTCTIPQGSRECFVEYVGLRGSDTWRMWTDIDKVQSTTEADATEGRYSGDSDCQQPEDQGTPCVAAIQGIPNPTPGEGCNKTSTSAPDDREPDCTDVVSVAFRSGPPVTIDCDDSLGSQSQDTERETNPTRPADTRTGDPSTEEYQCRAFDQFGAGRNGVVIKGENKSGANDPDRSTSYDSPDYQCTTTFDEKDPTIFLGGEGFCYISVTQARLETGTAEICFWTGSASEGAALCGDEPTGEAQLANGTDPANDAADQVEKTWENPATFKLDCDPETDTNPAGTAHDIICGVTSGSGSKVSGVNVDVEASGANDPDGSTTGNSPLTPDFTCTTGPDGTCTVRHGPGGTGSTTAEGVTTYRAWIDADRENSTTEADTTEGRDEQVTPGTRAEPDNTDVVEKTWTPPPTTVTITPASDTARVGECNPYTVTMTDRNGAAVPGAVLDVEQRHQLADNQAANDEPSVSFCEPPASAGPNPSNVDETRGDLRPPDENPENNGTAGGEATKTTDQNGKVTFGIKVAPGNGSNGSGTVNITGWWETDDNDDPGSSEPKASATKTWTPGSGTPGVPAGMTLSPPSSSNEPGEQVTYTATVSDGNGDPVSGAMVTWTEEGEGTFTAQETTTDENGQATATVTADREGTQTITASAPECAEGETCSDSSTQQWAEQTPQTCPGYANDSRNQIVGTPGNDTLRGTGGDDIICGFGGRDKLIGAGGDDLVLGGGGNDTLNGGRGKDVLKGNGGKDVIQGRGGNDRLLGQKGDDDLSGGGGNDFIDGGPGRDACSGGSGRDRVRNCE